MSKVDFKELEKLQKEFSKFDKEVQNFIESVSKELAARLLRKVILRTPVGDYSKEIEITAKRDSKNHKKGDVYTKKINPSGKKGGTLRRGWTGQASSASAVDFANSLTVTKQGSSYVIEIINPVEYASYVEFGHRTANHKGWVEGRFMLTISEQELEAEAPKIIEGKIKQFMEGIFRA